MLSTKENYLVAARGGKPEWVPVFPNDANFYVPGIWAPDPKTGKDWMGVTWIDEPSGAMPDVLHPVLSDISKWRDVLEFPDLAQFDWEADISKMKAEFGYDPDKVDIAMIHSNGPFLLPINLMGWEEGLAAVYEEPEELDALVTRLTDFLVEIAKHVHEHYHPQIMFSGDDLAAASGPLVSKQVWQDFYKKHFQRLVDTIHSCGALAEFHNCGNNGYLIEEFIALGADICQLPMPNANLLADKQKFGSRLVITGGWDRFGPAAKPGASEAEVRRSVHTAIDTYGKDGALIFWDGGIILTSEDSRNKMKWVQDELQKYGATVYRQ